MVDLTQGILDSARDLFYRQGFHNTGVDLISKEANITKRTLYRYFKTKDLLIEGVLKKESQQYLERLRHWVYKFETLLRPYAYLEFIYNEANKNPYYGCLFINVCAEYADNEANPHKLAKQHKQEIISFIEEICEPIHKDNSKKMAKQLFIIGEGLSVINQVGCGDKNNFKQIIKLLKQSYKKDRKNKKKI